MDMNQSSKPALPPRERIGLNTNTTEAFVLVSDGNPGALNALLKMTRVAGAIDPDNAFGHLGPLMFLDAQGIYGADIYVLHNEVCADNPVHCLAILRGMQMGLLRRAQVDAWIAGVRDRLKQTGPDFPQLVKELREQLPRFANGYLVVGAQA